MESSMGVGFMAVFAVSGSVVLLVHQVHKRLLSDFMKKIEYEISRSDHHEKHHHDHQKKRVRFAENVMEPASNNKEYRKRQMMKKYSNVDHKTYNHEGRYDHDLISEGTMPPNRQALYKGIIKFKTHQLQNG